MARILAALTLAIAPALVLASPAAAQSSGLYYHAVLEKPATSSRLISSEVVWYATANTMEAPIAGELPKQVCATLAHTVGAVTEFTAEGKALSAEDLAYCNKRARKTK
ncbi:hypothetical protein [Novosphingobium sp.]|uniref:CC_3452 family protein n=1 Tax=Novosphingobium sp. TaxID=1874826 RepID=UPI00333E3450